MSTYGGKLEGRVAGDQRGTIALLIRSGRTAMLDMGNPRTGMNVDINTDGSLHSPSETLRYKGD